MKHSFAFYILPCLLCCIQLYAQTKTFPAVPGVVVAHVPAAEKRYIGSPSLCRLPDGSYVASHDFFGPASTEHTSAVSRVYRSVDKGKTWQLTAQLDGQFWSKLFFWKNALYFMGTNRHHGNVVIRRSTDGGYTWSDPVDKLNGLLLEGEFHCAPVPFVEHNGRLWRAMEDAAGRVKKWGVRYSTFMMSIPVGADLMQAANWTCSNLLPYDSGYLKGHFGGWIEGNALVDPEGNMVNMLRVADVSTFDEKAAIVSISDDGKKASFDPEKDFVAFPGGSKKFTVRYDARSGRYWTLSNYVTPAAASAANAQPKKLNASNIRNTLALCSSSDLLTWKVNKIILKGDDVEKTGFQYVDWMFEGKDIVFVSRTAFDDGLGGAHRQHDANFLTFHRIHKFRKLSRKGFVYAP